MVQGLAAQVTAMHHQQTQMQVATQTMKMAMDSAEKQEAMVDKLLTTAMPTGSSADPNLGSNIDLKG